VKPALPCAALCAALLAGCTVGPDYHRPAIQAPSAWSQTPGGGATTQPVSAARWWTTFGDPTLSRLIERAVAGNLDVRMAQARVREARAIGGFAQAQLLPQVTASGSYSHQRISEHQPIIGSLAPPGGFPFENDVYQAGFDASWELDLFGGARRGLEAARADIAAAEAARQEVLVSLTAEVARDYIDLRAVQQQLAITRDSLHLQQQAMEIAQARFQGGLTSELDVSRAAALLAGVQSQIPALQQRETFAMHRLALLLGQAPGALTEELSQARPIPAKPPRVPVGLPSDLLRRRPDVRRAERQLAAATARIGVETAELFPRFSLTGNLGLQSIDTGTFLNGDSRYFAAGPILQWRLLDFGRIRSRIEAQDARQGQALAAYEKTILSALREVEDALDAYTRQQGRQQAIAEQVQQEQRSVETASALYAQGRINFLDVIDAQRSLYAARQQLVQSQQAVITNLIALYKGLGGGWQPFEPAPARRHNIAATPPGTRP
jgi:NodT family efflux transporter outer membrane factor (OMF) lipoprotein